MPSLQGRPRHPRVAPLTVHGRPWRQVLVTYGSRAIGMPGGSDPYGGKYKGISVCLELLKRALAGNYVNFGVFDLYGDPALKVRARPPVSLHACLRLAAGS